MLLGPLMVDLEGPELTAEERDLLRDPAVGGVILFSRNFVDPDQVTALTEAIHGLREPRLLIAVDQEGGRVQRFRTGFSRLPPAGRIGALYRDHPLRGRRAAELLGWLMAAELRLVGVDFSFAPVLDLDRGLGSVIGDRAFADRAEPVGVLAAAWMRGVHAAGMAAVGKHFPGHGGVAADSHTELPCDERPFESLRAEDLVPFERLIGDGLEAIMPAHVTYPRIDSRPAGFSAVWLQDLLRGQLGFQGAIFSDDLTMGAAASLGEYRARVAAALAAGCDMLLICNNRVAAIETAATLSMPPDPTAALRLLRMHGRHPIDRSALHADPRWPQAVRVLGELEDVDEPMLDLDDPTTRRR
ncbi:beta-N-acetylhexosaminidase [Thioalkalicoccus limnaeus]|uniref:Beta-hexosaminidase n=1 Tax=Thioalkalicoccus limnaeus TaxID=120681 RepID=A0ABV4BDL7_9GAMM